jgi:hypothetical protein
MSMLTIQSEDTTPRIAGAKKLAAVEEAISWPKGVDLEHTIPSVLFETDSFTVQLAKPGKETAPDFLARYKDGNYGPNPNDMRPEIRHNRNMVKGLASFTEIFEELQRLHLVSTEGITLIACLLARSAYMLDHVEISPGIWRYRPPVETIEKLSRLIPSAEGVPVEVFLHFLDALALNEDVKYHTLGYDIKTGPGRRNNLLTCVHVIAVMLGLASIAKFAGAFASIPRGISPLAFKTMLEIFPELAKQ